MLNPWVGKRRYWEKVATFAGNMRLLLTVTAIMLSLSVSGQGIDSLQTDTTKTQNLQDVTITSRRSGTRKMSGAVNGVLINREELFKAACCNLGESFTTNPSVDVNYSDAATGAKQIKLLGLSGTYVQMLTENLPNFRGAAAPYSLDYVPGPWMNSIQVSKGSSSVRNGYESITGQIDIEYLKPDNDEGVTVRNSSLIPQKDQEPVPVIEPIPLLAGTPCTLAGSVTDPYVQYYSRQVLWHSSHGISPDDSLPYA